MTGYRSKHFRHQCDRRGCYIQTLGDWDELGITTAFPRGIIPTDIDGMVEISNQFLFIDEKSEGVSLGTGQRRAFHRLSALPGVTVVVFRPSREHLEVITFPNPNGWIAMSHSEFVALLHDWAARAEGEVAA